MRRLLAALLHRNEAVDMRRGLIVGLGVLATLAGVIFALQGFGYLKGSTMTGTTLWSVLGPLIAVLGLSLVGLRAQR